MFNLESSTRSMQLRGFSRRSNKEVIGIIHQEGTLRNLCFATSQPLPLDLKLLNLMGINQKPSIHLVNLQVLLWEEEVLHLRKQLKLTLPINLPLTTLLDKIITTITSRMNKKMISKVWEGLKVSGHQVLRTILTWVITEVLVRISMASNLSDSLPIKLEVLTHLVKDMFQVNTNRLVALITKLLKVWSTAQLPATILLLQKGRLMFLAEQIMIHSSQWLEQLSLLSLRIRQGLIFLIMLEMRAMIKFFSDQMALSSPDTISSLQIKVDSLRASTFSRINKTQYRLQVKWSLLFQEDSQTGLNINNNWTSQLLAIKIHSLKISNLISHTLVITSLLIQTRDSTKEVSHITSSSIMNSLYHLLKEEEERIAREATEVMLMKICLLLVLIMNGLENMLWRMIQRERRIFKSLPRVTPTLILFSTR